MKSYSPIENVQSGVQYPHALVTGGLHDPRVGYWEPAKVEKEDFSPRSFSFLNFFSLRVFFARKLTAHLYISTKQQKTNSGSLASASWASPEDPSSSSAISEPGTSPSPGGFTASRRSRWSTLSCSRPLASCAPSAKRKSDLFFVRISASSSLFFCFLLSFCD